jgi:hypothetical protein
MTIITAKKKPILRVFIFVSRNSRKRRRSLQAAAPQDTETGRNLLECVKIGCAAWLSRDETAYRNKGRYNFRTYSDSKRKEKYNEFLRTLDHYGRPYGDKTNSVEDGES